MVFEANKKCTWNLDDNLLDKKTHKKGEFIMKIRFKEWNLGGKLVFISAILAIISLFMTWVDVGIFKASGFQQGGYIILVLFLYPIYKLLKNDPMSKIIGLISAVLALIIGISYLTSKSIEIFDTSVNVAGTGLYLYIIANIILIVGVIKYSVIEVTIE